MKTWKSLTASCGLQGGAQGGPRLKSPAAGLCEPPPCALPSSQPRGTPHLCCFLADTCDSGSWLSVSVKALWLPQAEQAYLSGCYQQTPGAGTKVQLGSLESELARMPLQ